jgi:hypothetical protein
MLRDRQSEASPIKFNIWFFLKDTWRKVTLSLLLAILLSVVTHLNGGDISKLLGQDWQDINGWVYVLIGFAPEMILQKLKKKYGFLQPESVDSYKRKQ